MDENKEASNVDDADLEDGEIETDEENDDVAISAPKIEQTSESSVSKKRKSTSDDEASAKKSSTKQKSDFHRKSSKGNSGTSGSNSNKKKHSSQSSLSRKQMDDDWMDDIENALANKLRKDGIEPKAPKPIPKPSPSSSSVFASASTITTTAAATTTSHYARTTTTATAPTTTTKDIKIDVNNSSSKSKSHKRRKHRSNESKSQRKKSRLSEDDNGKILMTGSNDSEDFDEYEMMNVRGGSPPSHGGNDQMQQQQQQQSSKKSGIYYDSDGSYTSGGSYDSGDHRMRRQRNSKRRAPERNPRSNRSGNSKRDKRRRDDSEDEGGGGGGGNNNQNNRNNNSNNNAPRKQELCKFYLMECCAKGEKCLYMHGDFPCKFYYLGMKNHNRENCKFSHGKPLTDQLRNILLKHLETAPKEIIGDFPRLSRDNAVNMINMQHQKLLIKFGMEPEPNQNLSNPLNSQKLPSLLDIVTKHPSPNNDHNLRKDKSRKSRWCDQRNNDIYSNFITNDTNHSHMQTSQTIHTTDSDLYLRDMTDILSADQIQDLSKMGIETVSQVTRLTLLQMMELGLTIDEISELQRKALSVQLNAKAKTQLPPSQQPPLTTTSTTTTTTTTTKTTSVQQTDMKCQDQDMRISIAPPQIDNLKENDVINQDVDMRILNVPPAKKPSNTKDNASIEQKSSNVCKFNTQFIKTTEENRSSKTELPKIDYSQYLRDANLDSNQSDGDDLTENADAKKKKINYESDEAEDSLVIEEEPLQIDESHNSSDSESNQYKIDSKGKDDLKHPLDEQSNEKLCEDDDGSSISINTESNRSGDIPIISAYAPASIYPTSVTNKIDLSSSVSQYMRESTTEPITKPELLDGNDDKSLDSCSSPTHPIQTNNDAIKLTSNFEFFTRQIPETSHPVLSALDEKLTEYDSGSENASVTIASPPQQTFTTTQKQIRKSIYEASDTDDDVDEKAAIANRRLSDDENDITFSTSKDKDMRLSSFLLEKDYSNGDVDLRLPFKPMANYIPATEIDASISSHAPIVYSVREVEIPKPDYSELRRSIPSQEKALDPRLRRILRLKEDPIDSELSLPLSGKSDLEISSPPHTANALLSSPSENRPRMDPRGDPRADPRADPRSDPRRAAANKLNQINTGTTSTVLNSISSTTPAQRSLHLDIQNILQKSNWYKECSSKQKIMVNQQLAIVSTELKKFHADLSDNKIFDLSFISQNPVLQEVLTNLGLFINDDGEFIQLDKSGRDLSPRNQNIDLMSIPLRNNLEMNIEFLRTQQQQQHQQQQQQQAMQQAMNVINAQPLGTQFPPSILAYRNMQTADVVRPGLLGIAPNIPFTGAFDQFFNRNVQSSNDNRRSNSGNVGTGSGGGNSGNRWISGTSNNLNRDSSTRRNQYDRNSSRRDKK